MMQEGLKLVKDMQTKTIVELDWRGNFPITKPILVQTFSHLDMLEHRHVK